MIPRTAVDPVIDVRVEELRPIYAERVLDGIACIHEYDPGYYAQSSWDRALSCVEHEVAILRELDRQAANRDEFDEFAYDIECEGFDRLELGVWPLVEALGAAGCPTFASCRSHRAGDVPFVVFGADVARIEILEQAARRSGCGLETNDDGLVMAWGPSLAEVLELASEILRRREDLDAIPPMVRREECVVAEDDW